MGGLLAPFALLIYLFDFICIHLGLPPQPPFVQGLVFAVVAYPLMARIFHAIAYVITPPLGPKPVSLEQQHEWMREADEKRASSPNGTTLDD